MTQSFNNDLVAKAVFFDTAKEDIYYQSVADFKSGKTELISFITKGNLMEIGIATGNVFTKDSIQYIEFVSNGAFDDSVAYVIKNTPAVEIKEASFTNTSQDQAQSIINNIIINNKKIYENLLVSAGFLAKLRAKGLARPEQEFQCQTLYYRLQARNSKLNNSMFLDQAQKQTGLEPVLSKTYGTDLDWIIANGHKGINALPLVAVYIIIAIAVTSIFAYLIYKAFRNTYSNSTTDLKASDDLMLALKSVDEPTRQAILQDLESQVDEAYAKGVLTAKDESFTGSLKNIALLMAGGFGLFWISKNVNTSEAKKKYGR